MPRAKAEEPKEEPRTVSEHDCHKDAVGERGVREKGETEKIATIGNVLVDSGLLAEEGGSMHFCGDE